MHLKVLTLFWKVWSLFFNIWTLFSKLKRQQAKSPIFQFDKNIDGSILNLMFSSNV